MTALLIDRSSGPSSMLMYGLELELLRRVELLRRAEAHGGGGEQHRDRQHHQPSPGPPQAHRGVSLVMRWRIAKSAVRPARSQVKAMRKTMPAVSPISRS